MKIHTWAVCVSLVVGEEEAVFSGTYYLHLQGKSQQDIYL